MSGMEQHRSCLLKIKGIIGNLKSAEHKVAQYIANNASAVVNMTINDLAAASDSSYATVNRVCKKLGYTGYKELKSDLMNDVLKQSDGVEISDIQYTPDMSTATICEKVYDSAHRTLEDSMAILDIAMIEKIADVLIKAQRIYFIGSGNSGISAKYAYSKFFRIRLNCIAEENSTLRRMLMSLIDSEEVVFAISSSGRSREVIDCVKVAKKRCATVISLSDFSISPLSKLSDYNIYTTPRNVSAFLNIDFPLTVGQIALIDILYICCCKKLGEKATDVYALTKQSAESEKIQ